ncbi:MAG: nitroreductase family protein [Dehalococcoidia bacterium]
MDVFDSIRTVLAVRQYADRPVPHEVVRKVVEAGQLTGSSKNEQPWHFITVERPETLRALGEVATSGRYVAGAAFAVAVAVERESIYGVSDGSRAVQSMVLAAWEEGVGSNWIGFANLEPVEEILGVPDGYDILALLSFGYPTQQLGRGKKRRKPLGEVASSERFGTPFA